MIEHHDVGWRELDANAPANPDTGLPYHLVETPFEWIVQTSSRSPEWNSEHHPYGGLLSSMHSWGLYNGRYGMSEMVLLDTLAEENRESADRMLEGERARQEALKARLADDPETAPWIEAEHLFQNYKQLQFFDTLALYFNCTAEGSRKPATFSHVPRTRSDDTDVSIRPVGECVYALTPFPFGGDEIEVGFTGRYLTPRKCRPGDTLGAELDNREKVRRGVRLVRGELS
jgi:hypothetical protein